MATVGEDLQRYLALGRLQHLCEAVLGFADRRPAGDQALERAQSGRTGDLPRRRPAEVAQLGGNTRQDGAAQRLIVIAPDDLVEVLDPGKDACRQHVGPPGDGMPGSVLQQPALNQLAGRLACGTACGHEVCNPAEAVPGSTPFRPGRWGEPTRRGMADELSDELDLTGSDSLAALGITRPA